MGRWGRPPTPPGPRTPGSRVRSSLGTVVLVFFAVAITVGVVALSANANLLAWDLRFAYLPAAEAVLDGESPYPALNDPILEDQKGYVYPPQLLLALVPLTPIPVDVAAVLVTAALLPCSASRFACSASAMCGATRRHCSGCLGQRRVARKRLDPARARRCCRLALPRLRWQPAWALGLAVSAKFLMWPLLVWTVGDAATPVSGAGARHRRRASRSARGLRSDSPGLRATRISCEGFPRSRPSGATRWSASRRRRGSATQSGRRSPFSWGASCSRLRRLCPSGRRSAVVHVCRGGDARPEPDRLAALPHRAARADGDRATAFLAPVASPRALVGEPATGVRRGCSDLHAGDRSGDSRRGAPGPSAAQRGRVDLPA